jgi:hypothetical protein
MLNVLLQIANKLGLLTKKKKSFPPDLTPCGFWLFPKLKTALKGQRFADIPDIQCYVMLLQGILENYF